VSALPISVENFMDTMVDTSKTNRTTNGRRSKRNWDAIKLGLLVQFRLGTVHFCVFLNSNNSIHAARSRKLTKCLTNWLTAWLNPLATISFPKICKCYRYYPSIHIRKTIQRRD
jgi:hypothetical protein